MGFDLLNFSSSGALQKQAVSEIVRSNEYTVRYGLELTEKQAAALVETRTSTLRQNGRIEFGTGVIGKLIYEFCDSPYLMRQNYEKTLHELIEIFYYYKNETLDLVSDDALIKYMRKYFDSECQGSLDYLSGTVLDWLAKYIRANPSANYNDTLPEPPTRMRSDSSSDD